MSEIASIPLDPTKPLWEIWLLEGYQGGKVVAVVKISHALADGESTRELLERALAAEPAANEKVLAPRGIRASAEAVPAPGATDNDDQSAFCSKRRRRPSCVQRQ